MDQVYRRTSTKVSKVSVPQKMKMKRRRDITMGQEKSDRYEAVLTRREALSKPKSLCYPLEQSAPCPLDKSGCYEK